MRQRPLKFLLAVLVLVGLPILVDAGTRQLSGYGWSSNVGWIKFRGSNYGVDYDTKSRYLQGYAWSPNIGWIRFSENIGGSSTGDNYYPASPLHGVRLTENGNFTGWARVCSVASEPRCRGPVNNLAQGWDGWIKFKGPGYQTYINTDSCALRGWAWGSEILGWIEFPARSLYMDRCDDLGVPQLDEPPDDINQMEEEIDPNLPPPPNCSFFASPVRVAKGGRATLSWDCAGTADSCDLPDFGIAGTTDFGSVGTGVLQRTANFSLNCVNAGGRSDFTAKTTVVRPTYCEVIPFIGGCR